jgi:TatD DNase family protein
MLIDIHTHRITNNASDIVSISADDYTPHIKACSIGIHPWHISPDWQDLMDRIRNLASAPNVYMIGECGLDNVRLTASTEEQETVFRHHIDISEQARKPLIIHCVKAIDRLIAIKKQIQPQQTWILHGFRGKPQQAVQLLAQGIELSFGPHFNDKSLLAAYQQHCLWFETDDSTSTIAEVYDQASQSLGTSIESLKNLIAQKARILFPANPTE